MKRLAKFVSDFDLFDFTLMKKALILLFLLSVVLGSCQSSESTSAPTTTPAVATLPPAPVPLPVVATAKFTKFNNPNELRSQLSMNGLGELHPWHNPGGSSDYMSITDDYQFGSPNSQTTLRNNMGYQLTGDQQACAQELVLYLDIFNSSERTDAIQRFQTQVGKTLKTLDIKKPASLLKSLKTNKPFTLDTKTYALSFYRDQSNIESWKLKITSK